jgi:predicted RNase H-like nuclease
LVSFDAALTFIRNCHSRDSVTLVALDQPTIVPNLTLTGMRPVERVSASLVSWLGGGVQPSNRGRLGMFCDASPIWRFLNTLRAVEDPEQSRIATDGLYVIEVFPALALASLGAQYFGWLRAPKYNPGRKKTFRLRDWVRVAETAVRESDSLGRGAGKIGQPRKADQDMLDSAICTLIALRWRLRPRGESLFLGDLSTGYMVVPVSAAVRNRLVVSAQQLAVPMDGVWASSPRGGL